MLRTHTCGELRSSHIGKEVTLCGWVQRSRLLGAMAFVDLRDRYGITQLAFSQEKNAELLQKASELGREFVVQASGTVVERSSKNPQNPTGDIEVEVTALNVLNAAKTPPFTIEPETDGGEELRMRYRYLDLRRTPLQQNLIHRHQLALEIRKYLDSQGFLEIETPMLIKSTPEGARDFVVPSRMNPGEFYALPQSPQTFKQILMVGGYDKYFQIVRCFRDEDLRADRQPEFTQLDCEMSFVEQEDVLQTFEGLARHLFQALKGKDPGSFARMPYSQAMEEYGSDKPDLRFGMKLHDITELVQGKGFGVFDSAERVAAMAVSGAAEYSRKQLDALTDWVKRPQIGATGLIWAKYGADGTLKSSVDKFFSEADLKDWASACGAKAGDLILVMAGGKDKTLKAMGELRLHLGAELGLRKAGAFACLWVYDFPLLDYSQEHQRWFSMHHPFTRPRPQDQELLDSDPGAVLAWAYDMVINGVEIGGGSIRIHERPLQEKIFKVLGFSDQEARDQFGFLLNAFEYGAPPHGGCAFGLDRWAAVLSGQTDIRDFIAFPKNNAGRDTMINSPSPIAPEQLKELGLK